MGAYVYGKRPRSADGEYFRIEHESWQELADLLLSLGPHDVVSNCKYWKYNEGDGLDDENAKLLAATLDADLASGKVDRYIAEHTNELYRESVERFVAFLKGCGGFKID